MNQNPFAQFQQGQAQAPAPAPFPGTMQPGTPAAPVAAPPAAFPAAAPPQAPQGFGTAGYPAPATAPGQGLGFGGFSINDLSEDSGNAPHIPAGVHDLEFVTNRVRRVKGYTIELEFKVLQSTDPAFPPGSKMVRQKKIDLGDQTKQKRPLGDILAHVRAIAGFSSEAEFKAQQWADQCVQMAFQGQELAPFKGRKIRFTGQQGQQVTDPKTKQPVPGKYYTDVVSLVPLA